MGQHKSKRDYKKEYARDHASPEAKRHRAMRNSARSAMEKIYGKNKIAGKDIDHKRRLKSGGTNKLSNLRIMSKHENRGRDN